MTLLTICIPTVPEPKNLNHLANLMGQLNPQLTDEVQVIIDSRPRKNPPTGVKRNDMYFDALGEYVCSIDDDDDISSVYVSEILKYIKEHKTDCVTFDGWMTTNGNARVDWTIKLGENYEARKDPDGVTRYYRFPNHLVPIKKSLAVQVKFPPITNGEDYQWASKIQPILKSSVHIPLRLYHYKFITNK